MKLLDALMSMALPTSKVLDAVLTYLRPYQWYASDTVVACVAIWVLLRWLHVSRRQRFRTTELRGPPSESFFYGVGRRIEDAEDAGALYEAWAREYGPVYAAPSTLGKKRIVLCDTKAIAHFYSKEMWTYIQTPFTKMAVARTFGKGLTWAHGEDHKRQRRALTPGFTIPAIRQLTSIFYDAAYKAKGAWDVSIEASEGDNAVVDVQNWMSQISLDVIGLAGFSHNFGALEGKRVDVAEVFKAFSSPSRTTSLDNCLILLGLVFPFVAWIPAPRMRLLWKFNNVAGEISEVLLARTRKELEMGIGGDKGEESIIGLLIKGANADSDFHLTKEEITAQMKVLILAGYETISVSLTWALLELSRNPDVQTRLRNELLEHGADPTFDQLTNDLPYLDAVVHEVLRVHTPVTERTRVAVEDDIIPLSEPVRTTSGELIDRVMISKGTLVTITMESINRSVAIWGKDAKVFRPSRWLEDAHGRNGIPAKARELQGHRHLLTFADGAKMCLGKHFALTEFKAVLTVLVKNFVFELRDGADTKIKIGRGMLPRPRIADEEGCKLPLRVRPYVT